MQKALFLSLALALASVLPTQAATPVTSGVQSQPLPPQQYQVVNQPVPSSYPAYQAPPTLPNGNANLIHYWYEYGGARLYWRGPIDPQQIKLMGSGWTDPASHSLLTDDGNQGDRKKRWRGKRKTQKPAPKKDAGTSDAPADAGKTALQAPKADNGAAAQQKQGSEQKGAQQDASSQAAKATITRAPKLKPGPKPTTYTEIRPKTGPVSVMQVPATQAGAAVAPLANAPTPAPIVTPAPQMGAGSTPTMVPIPAAGASQASASANTNITRQ